MEWILYGASGYTGMLMARRAVKRGMKPILAGRQEGPIRNLAEELKLKYRVFSLDRSADVDSGLEGAGLVINCAGPFSSTFEPMVQSCLRKGSHYLDITGELGVFERAHQLSTQARDAKIAIIPGTGFDVVPSDCLAAALSRRMANASALDLAIQGTGGVSRGTLKTSVEGILGGCKVRRSGALRNVGWGSVVRNISFSNGEKTAMAIPWGDLVTAFYSTSIPNITVYMAAPPKTIRMMKLTQLFSPVLKLNWMQRMLKKRVDSRSPGPSDETLATAKMYLWGQVTAPDGKTIEATLETPEGYALTVETSLSIVNRTLKGEVSPGYWTPSQAFGPEFIKTIPGTKLTWSKQ